MKIPFILFRKESLNKNSKEEEYEACKKYFPTHLYRSTIPMLSDVLCRYSAAPHYNELCTDIHNLGSTMIQSHKELLWITGLDWLNEDEIIPITPQTWQAWQLPYLKDVDGPFVIKGQTKSKKENWKTHMFANNKQEAIEVVTKLYQDEYIGRQDLIIRKYIPLKNYGKTFTDLPISNEWRCFFYKDKLIHNFYYWNAFVEEFDIKPCMNQAGIDFMYKVSKILDPHLTLKSFDIAETETGEWILIEINDLQMSGLNDTCPETFYKNLQKVFIV